MNKMFTLDSPVPRTALIGCGAWGKNLARVLNELGSLVAVCDDDDSKAQDFSQLFNVPAVSEEALLADPEIDGVMIASLAPLHADQALKALEVGKHVYIEKPMALTTQEAKKISALAKEKKRTLMVGHILHYHPAFIALKKLLPDLGKIHHIYANRLGLGRFRRQESVLWDLASHDVSLILALTNQMPVAIQATGQAYVTEGKPGNALLTLTFPQQLTAHIHTSWVSPFKEQKLVVIGENGLAVFDDQKPWAEKLQVSTEYLLWQDGHPHANDRFKTTAVPLEQSEPLKNECLHFLSCIQKGVEPLTSGQDGLNVTEILEKAEISLNERNAA